jgi:hypothetical protein
VDAELAALDGGRLGGAELGLARVVPLGDGTAERARLRVEAGEELAALRGAVDLVRDGEPGRDADGEPQVSSRVTPREVWPSGVRAHASTQSRACDGLLAGYANGAAVNRDPVRCTAD